MLLLEAEENMIKPDDRNGQAQTDAETHIKVKIIGEDRLHRGHALVPAMKDAVFVENRVGNEGDKEADAAPDHRPEGEHHSDKEKSEIELNAGGHRREKVFRNVGELNPGDGKYLDGFRKNHARRRREQDVESPKNQADHAADGKDPPFPAGFISLSGFGQGHVAQSSHRGHREGEFFHIGSEPVEGITEAEVIHRGDDLKADHQQDRDQPVAVEKGAIHQGLGTERRCDPGRNVLSEPQHSRRFRLHQILVPEQA